MIRSFHCQYRFFAASCLLALGLFGLGTGGVQAQLAKPKPRVSNDIVVKQPDLKVEKFSGTWPRPGKVLLLGGYVKNVGTLPYGGTRMVALYSIRADKTEALVDTVKVPALKPGESTYIKFRQVDPQSVQTFNFKMEIIGPDGNKNNDSATTNVSEV